jgi:LmbE family N-acetylglucosaminyl deacetylase
MKTILVIAPHPDDEVLGCGGTIAKHRKNGDKIELCILTKAYLPDWTKKFIENRKREIKKANGILGIKKTHLLDFPTVKLDTFAQKDIISAIGEVVDRVKPDIVYLPHQGDLNNDHRLIYEASLVALKPIKKYLVNKILAYETLSETEWGSTLKPFIPNVYLEITETIQLKKEAMMAYGSEIKDYPHPRSLEMIEILAKKRGSESGLNLAEAFMLVREISV